MGSKLQKLVNKVHKIFPPQTVSVNSITLKKQNKKFQ